MTRLALLQRKCACGQHTPGGGECEECRKKKKGMLQRSALGQARTGEAPSIVHEVLRSPGQPLEPSTREVLEPRFGRDFSQVRVHTDRRAAESARAVNALAYTAGREIVFAGGRYQPRQREGLKLLAHELTHVTQQEGRDTAGPLCLGPAGDAFEKEADRAAESGFSAVRATGAPSVLQRKITVTQPEEKAPFDPSMTEPQLVESWLDKLCPTGGWEVDPNNGAVKSPKRDTFCAESRTPGQAHFSSRTPTSCQCLCELTAPESPDVRVHVTDVLQVREKGPWGEKGEMTERNNSYDLGDEGEGFAALAADGGWDVGMTGRENTKIGGVGDSSPLAEENQRQTIRDPAWLIFGHELCGHVRLGEKQDRIIRHSQTMEGDLTAVDIENRIRREHSRRTGDNLGIRRGELELAAGKLPGSVYRVEKNETLAGIATRCGLAAEDILTHIFHADGSPVTAETQVQENERLLILGIKWHDVIEGETLERIARMWGHVPSALLAANPWITDPQHIEVGWRLLIPKRPVKPR